MTDSINQTTDQLITQILSDAPGSDFEDMRRRLVMSDKPTHTQVELLIRRAYKAATMCITKDDAIIRELAATITALQAECDAAVARAEALANGLPKPCDGKEQYAFEGWAKENHYDMNEHPLHYIFLDPKTNAARMGWNACIKYMLAALSTDAKGE